MKYRDLEIQGEQYDQQGLEELVYQSFSMPQAAALPTVLKRAREYWVDRLASARTTEELWEAKGAIEAINLLKGRFRRICDEGPAKKQETAVADEPDPRTV